MTDLPVDERRLKSWIEGESLEALLHILDDIEHGGWPMYPNHDAATYRLIVEHLENKRLPTALQD